MQIPKHGFRSFIFLFALCLSVILYSQSHASTPLIKTSPTPAPALDFEDKAGNGLNLSQWKGKVVVINLWAPWCAPCITEMPSLNRFAATFRPMGVSVIPVSIGQDTAQTIQKFYDNYGLTHLPIARDPGHVFLRGFGVSGLPSSFILNKRGEIVGRFDGATNWDNVQLHAFIKFLMSE